MTGIVSSVPASVTVDTTIKMNEIPEWFPGARLNYAENLLRSVYSLIVCFIHSLFKL